MNLYVADIRKYFREQYNAGNFTQDRNGGKTIELIGASFIADEASIFGEVNEDYVRAEINWYESQSTNINDIYHGEKEPPAAWKGTGDRHGNINSNYGYLIYSESNGNQFENAVSELVKNPDSRRAAMIYTRPSIWLDYNEGGKSDFICTNAVTYYIRNGQVHAVVQMRSNDAIFGYKNDYAWAKYVLNRLTAVINSRLGLFDPDAATYGPVYTAGNIHWQCQNLHIYDRHFKFLE